MSGKRQLLVSSPQASSPPHSVKTLWQPHPTSVPPVPQHEHQNHMEETFSDIFGIVLWTALHLWCY